MEICQCKRYMEAVDHFKSYTVGTLHELIPREKVPDDKCIKWTCNKTNPDEARFYKPILVSKYPGKDQKTCEKDDQDEHLESKWIPVLPGLISQRLVNESKHIYSPY